MFLCFRVKARKNNKELVLFGPRQLDASTPRQILNKQQMASPSLSDYEESADDLHDEEAAAALWGRGSPSPLKSPSPPHAQAAADDSLVLLIHIV